jgi:ABC-type sulfate transport system permease component
VCTEEVEAAVSGVLSWIAAVGAIGAVLSVAQMQSSPAEAASLLAAVDEFG